MTALYSPVSECLTFSSLDLSLSLSPPYTHTLTHTHTSPSLCVSSRFSLSPPTHPLSLSGPLPCLLLHRMSLHALRTLFLWQCEQGASQQDTVVGGGVGGGRSLTQSSEQSNKLNSTREPLQLLLRKSIVESQHAVKGGGSKRYTKKQHNNNPAMGIFTCSLKTLQQKKRENKHAQV